jgi:hypothetical protein
MKHRLLLWALAIGFSGPVFAGGAGPMWVFPVGRLCAAQDPRYAEALLGRLIVSGKLKLASSEFNRCARAKQWIPDHICADLMSLDPEQGLSRSNLDRLGERWSPELKVLQVAGPYVMASAQAELAGRELPPCP